MKGPISLMRGTTTFINSKRLAVATLSIAVAAMLVIGWLATIVNASSVVHVTTNVADVAAHGDSFVLTVGTQNDGDVWELEIDHNFDNIHPGILPEFSVYADEADPYGGDGALFASAGATVTYSAASNQWVIDLGDTITQDIIATGDDIIFYFALRDTGGAYLWGGMNPPVSGNTFTYDLVDGIGDVLIPQNQTEGETEAVVPGVPNTSVN